MCGIHAVISASAPGELSPSLRQRLCSRGPDHISTHEARLLPSRSNPDDDGDGGGAPPTEAVHLAFNSTVLALRGDRVARQPFVDPDTGSVLCWNGEAWRVRHHDVGDGNDGEAIAGLLSEAVRGGGGARDREEGVLRILRSIDGPFAFVFLDRPSGRVYFGRDRLGRRSLLVRADGAQLVLSSVAGSADESWKEVEADGVYVLDLGGGTPGPGSWSTDPCTSLSRREWVEGEEAVDFVSAIGRFNESTPQEDVALTADSPSVEALRQHLVDSLKMRILNVPAPPRTNDQEDAPKVAVLFSGGLDCTVMARLCHDLLPSNQSIDLINVAFENPRVAANAKKVQDQESFKSFDIYEACPDRLTGRKSFAELQSVCPGRAWRFIAVNVPYSEYLDRKSEVTSLIYPHNTEMDLSIACALYFSARGQGTAFDGVSSPRTTPYTTPARVLLSGLGADELFGGYIRHATAFQRQGYRGLVEELKLDVSRLGKRNLGRDDRAMSHWGREVRFPFLDEDLVRWAINIPVWEKCDFGRPDGNVEAGKRVLRLLALELGMAGVAAEKKRAIQFGSRTAKMESGKVKGTTLLS